MSERMYIRDNIPMDDPDREKRLQEMFIFLHRARKIVPSHENVYVLKCNPYDPAQVQMAGLEVPEYEVFCTLEPGANRYRLPDEFTRPLVDYLLAHTKDDWA